jgi:seryl-tRNA synthetase
MSMNWSLIMDVVVAGLLVATIVYAMQLSRRLATLKNDRNHLQELIKGLQKATDQAESAVGNLKTGSADAGKSLHQAIERADLLKADLAFIAERAEATADRLESLLKTQREATTAAAPISIDSRARRADKVEVEAASAQSRLATLLKQADSGAPPRPTVVPSRPAAVEAGDRNVVQSRAERDLMRALETRR